MTGEVRLRVRLADPPRDVLFAMQRGRAELVAPTSATDAEISFDLTVRVADTRPDGMPNFLGPFAQGPPAGRFLYVNSGRLAGQPGSCWTRRAKVPLSGITWPMVDEVLSSAGAVLEARIPGTAGDGGPVCASIRAFGGWRVVPAKGLGG
jgi:hypothetical protein